MNIILTQEDIDNNPIFAGVEVGSVITISSPEAKDAHKDGDPVPTDPTKPPKP